MVKKKKKIPRGPLRPQAAQNRNVIETNGNLAMSFPPTILKFKDNFTGIPALGFLTFLVWNFKDDNHFICFIGIRY